MLDERKSLTKTMHDDTVNKWSGRMTFNSIRFCLFLSVSVSVCLCVSLLIFSLSLCLSLSVCLSVTRPGVGDVCQIVIRTKIKLEI